MIINEIGEIENFEQRFTIKATIYENDATIINEVIDEKTKNVLIKKTEKNIDSKEMQIKDHDYRIFKKIRKYDLFPKIYWRGFHKNSLVTIEEKLGPNLKEIFLKYHHAHFSVPTICLIAIQVVKALSELHGLGLTYNSLSPQTILLSRKITDTKLYFSSLRNSRKILKYSKLMQSVQGQEKPIRVTKFSSLNIHLGQYPSRKDDLESLAYMIVYFFRDGKMFDKSAEKTANRELKLKMIEKQKLNLTSEVFCQDLPSEILDFFSYVKSLKHLEKPDYTKINRMFRDLLTSSQNHQNTLRYDWVERALSSIEQKKAKKKGVVNTASEMMMEAKDDQQEDRLGAIDLDADANFRVNNPEETGDSDDDESNVDEESAQEFPDKLSDPKELTTIRLAQGYTYSLIKNRMGPGA